MVASRGQTHRDVARIGRPNSVGLVCLRPLEVDGRRQDGLRTWQLMRQVGQRYDHTQVLRCLLS